MFGPPVSRPGSSPVEALPPVDSLPSSPSAVLRLDPSSCRPSLPPPVFPRRASSPLTYGSGWQDFSGSHDFLVHMTWSPTPAVCRRLAISATAVLPSAIKAASARAMRFISWPNTDPAHSLSTLSPERYQSGPKTRYEASGAGATSVELSSTGHHELLLSHSDFDPLAECAFGQSNSVCNKSVSLGSPWVSRSPPTA